MSHIELSVGELFHHKFLIELDHSFIFPPISSGINLQYPTVYDHDMNFS